MVAVSDFFPAPRRLVLTKPSLTSRFQHIPPFTIRVIVPVVRCPLRRVFLLVAGKKPRQFVNVYVFDHTGRTRGAYPTGASRWYL